MNVADIPLETAVDLWALKFCTADSPYVPLWCIEDARGGSFDWFGLTNRLVCAGYVRYNPNSDEYKLPDRTQWK